MDSPQELRARATRYRDLVRQVGDERAIAALRSLADQYEQRAKEIEAGAPIGSASDRRRGDRTDP
jgi:hypothetical protein